MRRTGPTNIVLRKIIRELRVYANRYKAPIWDAVADYLMRSSRKRVVVNLSKISRYARDGDVIVVPGKVLGGGDLKKKVVIAAFSFSKTALEKIRISGSKPMTIKDLLRENPEGRGVRIFA